MTRPKPCEHDSIRSWVSVTDVDIWHRDESIELGEICCPTCELPHYPWKSNRIWVPGPWFRFKSLIPIEQHLEWQVIHSSCHSKGSMRRILTQLSPFSLRTLSTRTKTKWKGCLCCLHYTNACHVSFKTNIELKMYSRVEYDSRSMVQHQQLHEIQKNTGLIKDKKTPQQQ